MFIMKLRKMVKPVIIGVAVVFAGSLLYGFGMDGLGNKTKTSSSNGDLVARVNGEPVYENELSAKVKEMVDYYQANYGQTVRSEAMDSMGVGVLNQIVDAKLMQQETVKEKVEVSDSTVDKKIEEYKKGFPSSEQFQAVLQQHGYTLDTFKEALLRDMAVQKLQEDVRNKVKVSKKDVMDGLDEVKASHILIKATGDNDKKAKAKAEDILKKVKDGGDFAALAKQYSDDPGSAQKGGDLGFFKHGMMLPEFDNAAFNLKVGEVSGLVKTSYGYHIIKVTDRKEVKIKDKKEEAKVRKDLLNTKQSQYFAKWFDALKKKAKIEVVDHRLKGYQFKQEGKLDDAIKEFKLAANQDTYNAYNYSNIGSIYEQQNKLDDALANYKKAVELVKYDPDLKLHLATAYQKKNMFKEAATELKDVAQLAPKDMSLLSSVKSLYETMKMPTEAAEIGKMIDKAQQEQIAQWQQQMEQQKQVQDAMKKQTKDKKDAKKK